MADAAGDSSFSSLKDSSSSLKVQVQLLSGETVATVPCESETQIGTVRKKAELQADRFLELTGPSGQIF